jgi:hypothetical protein
MRYVSDKIVAKINKTHFSFHNHFVFENRAASEIMCKKNVKPGRPKIKIWRMRIACWIPKVTNKHSVYVIFIAFPPQQWLQKEPRASMLRYMNIACIVVIIIISFMQRIFAFTFHMR